MKTMRLAMVFALTVFTGCAVTAGSPTSDPTDDDSITSTPAVRTSTAGDELTLNAALTCNGVEQACTTGFNCHHQEGGNIGIRGCPTGLICCQF